MKCPDCNRSIPADSRFCSYCGTRLQTCQPCQLAYSGDAGYCGDCGRQLPVRADGRAGFDPADVVSDDALGLLYDPDDPDTAHELGADDRTVGAGGNNDIVIDDPTISWNHAVILSRDDGLRLQDTASTNGTFVQDREIEKPQPVDHGDTVRFGDCEFRVWLRPELRES